MLFNIGVEIGQLVALGVIVGVAKLALRWRRPAPNSQRIVFGTIAATGLVAAAVISSPSGETDRERQALDGKEGRSTTCSERSSPPPSFPEGDGHPAKAFYGPRETAPVEAPGHAVGHG